MKVHPLVRMMRPSLAPTAAADVLAAAAFAGAGAGDVLPLAYAVSASVCLYCGGMVLNDICDRERDKQINPARPLVETPALLFPARLLATALFSAGILLGWLAGALPIALAVAALAVGYDLGLKRRFPADALSLGGARAANLALGFAVAGGAWGASVFTYVTAYLLYIAGITVASRAEDMEPPPTRRLTLLMAFVPKLLALGGLWSLATDARGFVFLIPAALLLCWLVLTMAAGTREAAKRYVFRALLAIFLLHGCALWGASKVVGLIPILACAAASYFLLGLTGPPKPEEPNEART